MEILDKLPDKMLSGCRAGCLGKSLFSEEFSALTTQTTHNHKKNRIIVAELCIEI